MNHSISIRPAGLPDDTADPPIAKQAAFAIARLLDPAPGIDFGAPSATAVREAAAALPAFEAACRPASRPLVRAWLEPIAASVAVAPSERDLDMRLAMVLEATYDLPASVFNRQTLRQALRTFKFWPTPAEVDALLRPVGEKLLRKLAALRSIAAAAASTAAPPEPAQPKLGDAERDAILARFRAMRAGLLPAVQPDEPATPPRPSHGSRQELTGLYEAQARSADPRLRALALARLRMLGAEPAAGDAATRDGIAGHQG